MRYSRLISFHCTSLKMPPIKCIPASPSRKVIVSLMMGVIIGFASAAVFFLAREQIDAVAFVVPRWREYESSRNYHDHDHHHHHDGDVFGSLDSPASNQQFFELSHQSNHTIAEELKQKVRVLCWIMTSPTNHKEKAVHVKATWGKRCNTLVFMSSKKDDTLPSIALPVKEGRNNLWGKTKEAFKYVYEHYNGTYDWVLKADDDTYVIVENLRYMLSTVDPSKPIYFGCRFKPYVKQGYMSGGAGYVLSREAVRRFVKDGLKRDRCRRDSGGAEDVEIGTCLEAVGVEAGDSRDSLGRGRFFPFVPEHHLAPGHTNHSSFWYWQYIYYPSTEGRNCCSDTTVSFHYVAPSRMYAFDFLLYHLRPYGISYTFARTTTTSRKQNEIERRQNTELFVSEERGV